MSLMQSAHRSVMKCSHFHFTYEKKRDIASYSQKALEHLMPLETSCRAALKYLQKNTHAWEISSGLPSIQYLAESPKMWQMHVSVSRGTAVTPRTEQLPRTFPWCCGTLGLSWPCQGTCKNILQEESDIFCISSQVRTVKTTHLALHRCRPVLISTDLFPAFSKWKYFQDHPHEKPLSDHNSFHNLQ